MRAAGLSTASVVEGEGQGWENEVGGYRRPRPRYGTSLRRSSIIAALNVFHNRPRHLLPFSLLSRHPAIHPSTAPNTAIVYIPKLGALGASSQTIILAFHQLSQEHTGLRPC